MNKTLEEIAGQVDDQEEQQFDEPNGSVWIVSVDHVGRVSVLAKPNIHPGFFESDDAECMGLPFDLKEYTPGVYRWVCDFWEGRDYLTGVVDDWGFNVREETLLWSLPEAGPKHEGMVIMGDANFDAGYNRIKKIAQDYDSRLCVSDTEGLRQDGWEALTIYPHGDKRHWTMAAESQARLLDTLERMLNDSIEFEGVEYIRFTKPYDRMP